MNPAISVDDGFRELARLIKPWAKARMESLDTKGFLGPKEYRETHELENWLRDLAALETRDLVEGGKKA